MIRMTPRHLNVSIHKYYVLLSTHVWPLVIVFSSSSDKFKPEKHTKLRLHRKKSSKGVKLRRSDPLRVKECLVSSCSVCLLPILQEITRERNFLRVRVEVLLRENHAFRDEIRKLKGEMKTRNVKSWHFCCFSSWKERISLLHAPVLLLKRVVTVRYSHVCIRSSANVRRPIRGYWCRVFRLRTWITRIT
jgi:hypothetical protein